MSSEPESIAEQIRVQPTTIEEAEEQLDLIKLAKKQLNIEKDYIIAQQEQERDQYSAQITKSNAMGDGVVRLISEDASKKLRSLGNTLDDYYRRGLAKDLEPLEAERAMIEAALIALDERALELEVWITMQELYPPEEGETVPPPGTRTDGQLVVVPTGMPTTLEEAEAQLELVKLRQEELNIEKKKVAEAERLAREANTSKDRKGATRGKGLVSVVAPDAADVLEETEEMASGLRDRRLGRDLEELEDERMAIEKEINQLELQEMELEKWIDEEEARLEAEEEAQKEAEAAQREAEEAEATSEADAEAAAAAAQAEAEKAKAEAEKAQAEAEIAKAEAEKAQAEAEKAKAEAEKAKGEAESASAAEE